MTLLEELRAVRDLLADPARFTTGTLARDARGWPVSPTQYLACRWCLVGAIRKVGRDWRPGSPVYVAVRRALNTISEPAVATWSDLHGHAGVLELLDRLIADEEKVTMNKIETLQAELERRFPDATFCMTRPVRDEDEWALDIRLHDRWLVVGWQAPTHFSVSSVTDDTFYGEGPDQVWSDPEAVLATIARLLTADDEKTNG